jgi:hypothetical protein
MSAATRTDHQPGSATPEEHLMSSAILTITPARARLGALALAFAGICFVLYPALRPFSDEATLAGARAFASDAWFAAHLLAMIGFMLTALGLVALRDALRPTRAEGTALWAQVTFWLGTALVLPYYGAEDFALRAIAAQALRDHNAALLTLASDIRFGPAIYVFGAGLLLLAVGGVLAAVAVWRAGTLARWSGLPLALGFVLFLPQFFGTQPIRVAHGALLAVGCLWLAAGLWRQGRQSAA